MDYQKFYQEVVAWINEANNKAGQLGFESPDYWTWVTRSIGELCDRYGNNPLVIKQMNMLHDWLTEIYYERGN